uniref:Si:dkey-177p2.16 n=2 Tax=Nothobranchius pienaari TaxID=704102 RepID=A0A1A8NED2_9TELE
MWKTNCTQLGPPKWHATTRFASYSHLMAFWRQIESATHDMVRVTRAQTALGKHDVPHSTGLTALKPIDEMFLFLTYLSLGLLQKDLAHRFKIHQSTVSHIINTWANFLYTVLGAVGIWMSEDKVKAHLPDVFKNYSNTQVLLDCTELQCQTPSSLLLQSEVFSTYKSHCTFKGLIGMAPHGAITFVSSLHEGSISDKEILKQSGIVSLLKPTAAIMVDKGFLVEDCVPCKVYIPAFLSKREQLSGAEVRQTQSIARLRVHIERIIGRVKEHKIFSTVIPLSLTGSINQLYTVSCLLVNYQNGPIVKAWARSS